jgi:hypothetical protein
MRVRPGSVARLERAWQFSSSTCALIGDAARQDAREPFDSDRFEAAVEFLREFAARRPGRVLDEVARLRRGASSRR